ncbi:MAG TPA: anti-sigma factor [Acidimicrobiales bacterium]
MTHDEVQDLLGAYALDAVDDDERALVEDHLAECPRCRAEVHDHREVAALLAHGGQDAPEGIWDRIVGSLEEAPPALRLAPMAIPDPTADGTTSTGVNPLSASRRAPRRVVAALAAAAAVAIVAVLGVQVRQQNEQIDDLQVALDDPLSAAYSSALTDPASKVIELTSADGATRLRGALADDGVGYLRADELPELPDDRTYQLWGAAGDELVSLGVLGADPGIVSFPAAAYELFAITEEAAPGVVTSANPPVVAGSTA